jgi:phosphate-selective porin OprO and OprP
MRRLIGASVLGLAMPIFGVAADQAPPPDATSSSDSVQQLREELEREQAHIKALEDRLATVEAAQATTQAAQAAANAPSPGAVAANSNSSGGLQSSFGPQGYTLQSADGANSIHFRGNVSLDGRFYSDAYTPDTDDTWLIRRLRPTLEGTIDNYFDYRIMPDFAQGKAILQDGWADARIEPWLVLEFGKFKAPVGLERLQLEQFNRFLEAALTADLLPYRDLGVKLGGAVDGGVFAYDVGVFDGAPDGGSTDGNSVPDENSTGKFSWDGRVFVRPFLFSDIRSLKGFGAGIAATYVNVDGIATGTTTTSLLAADKTPGQQSMFAYRADTNASGGVNNATIADGIERRIVPQFYYYYGPFGLLGEYVDEAQEVERRVTASSLRIATLTNTAWQLQGSVFLTGEEESYDSVTPRSDFGFGQSGTGAWEFVARYHELNFDKATFEDGLASFANPLTAPRTARAIGAGINWYLNRNFKTQLDYEVTRYDGGAPVGDRPAERVLISQFALIF